MVILPAIEGRPFAPKTEIVLSVELSVILAVRVIISASPLPLAVLIAAISSAAVPTEKDAAYAV